ncbi:MAG: hypothetical protein ACRDKZ_14895, partial [Actinomycetota bacterium]
GTLRPASEGGQSLLVREEPFFIDEDARRLTVVAVHPDSESLEFHMEIAGPEFRKMTEFVALTTIEVYGRPSDKALTQLQKKAEMLGEGGSVVVQEPQAGFARSLS